MKSHGFVCTQIPVKPFEIYTQTLKYKDRERERCALNVQKEKPSSLLYSTADKDAHLLSSEETASLLWVFPR